MIQETVKERSLGQGLGELVATLGMETVPQHVLVGALLEIASHYNRMSRKVDEWAKAGDAFSKDGALSLLCRTVMSYCGLNCCCCYT